MNFNEINSRKLKEGFQTVYNAQLMRLQKINDKLEGRLKREVGEDDDILKGRIEKISEEISMLQVIISLAID